MVLGVAPNKRELEHLMRWQDSDKKRSRENSLEQRVKQHSNGNGHHATYRVYVFVLPDISANSIPVLHGMTPADLEVRNQSVADSNASYNKGIEHIVENNHNGLFERIAKKVYDAAAHGLKYVSNGLGYAASFLVPKPVRYATASSLVAFAAACITTAQPENNPGNLVPTPTIVRPTATFVPTGTPAINSSYDLAKSLGLEDADYLRDLKFDDNAKEFVRYLSTMPVQMRAIAERSGLVKKLDDKQAAPGLVDDRQITLDELAYFKGVIESYTRDIENVMPWLNQISEENSLEALALNLRNFREADEKGQLIVSLKGERVPALLSTGIFYADGEERKYEDEIRDPETFKTGAINAYAAAAVKNITNFLEIQKKAWEVANSPDAKYNGRSIEEIFNRGHFQGESVGSTDAGLNAYEDISLLVKEGSPEAKAALLLYARNLTREGRQGSAEQVRVELTNIDAWSIGISSYEVDLAGHDVPAIRITDSDIALLKKRSSDPLLILDIDGRHYLPFQWTRTSIVQKEWAVIRLYSATGAKEIPLSDLKPY